VTGQFAIACYRPKLGQEQALLETIREHAGILRKEGFLTDKRPYVMQARDGTFIEVFEWKSPEAKQEAHQNAAVGKVWQKFSECAEFPPLANLEECRRPFASFVSVKL